MPRAETHKSRLGWNKKEDVMGWGRQGLFFHRKYMERGKGLHLAISATTASPPASPPPDAVIRFALPCAQKNGSEYSCPVPNS